MNKKTLSSILVVSVLSFILIVVFLFNSIEKEKDKNLVSTANFISNIVEDSFNNIEKSDNNHKYLNDTLSSILKNNDVNSIHFSKSRSFEKGKVINENAQIEYTVNDKDVSFTIPMFAKWSASNDCTMCHNIKYGEFIGYLSLNMNLNKVNDGISIFYVIPFILVLTVLIIIFLSNKAIKANASILKKFSKSLNSSLGGKYKKVEVSNHLPEESAIIVNKYNQLLTDFDETSKFIDKRLKGFVGIDNHEKGVTPLEESKKIISNLSNLYQFKKEIELDNSNEEIFNRISEVFINQYNLKNFNFVEINNSTNKIKVLKEHGDCFYCGADITTDPSLCRAARTNNDVISIDYHHSCPYFNENDRFHYCVSTNIIKDINLIVNFVLDSKEELEELKSKISLIRSYINESVPSIEVKLLMNALQESAYVDGLTGLYNRKFLDVEMQKLIPLAKREDFDIGVLLLDMDHFKAVNDEYGHDIGDKVLKELASIIDETVRESDIAVRYGGEEFLVLLVNVRSEENARKIADKIRVKVSEREIDVYAGSKLRKTISVGLSMYPQDSSNIDGVIKNADIALYEAKNKGRNQVVRFNEEQVTSVDLF